MKPHTLFSSHIASRTLASSTKYPTSPTSLCRAASPEEDDGHVQGGGEVEGGVGVPLAGAALSEVADDAALLLAPLEGVRRAHRWGGGAEM